MLKNSLKILSIVSVMTFMSLSHADARVLVEQGKIIQTVSPGATIADSIVIHNTAEQPTQVKIYWSDFEYIEPFNGTKRFLNSGTLDNSLADWISWSPELVKLQPYGKKKINYTIKVPADAVGGHYGVMFFESDGDRPQTDIGVSVVTRIGSLFFIETENRDQLARVEDIQIKGSAVEGVFYNDGNVIMIPETTYYVIDSEGLVQDRGEVKKFYLPPNKNSAFSFDFSDSLSTGVHTVIMTFDLGNGSSVVKEMDIVKESGSNIRIQQMRD